MTTTGNEGFALSGLVSRGGLSNWVFFFFPDALVMVDVGIGPSLKAGAQAGVLGQLGGEGVYLLSTLEHGPRARWGQALRAWLEQLRPKAKRVVTLPDAEVREAPGGWGDRSRVSRLTGGVEGITSMFVEPSLRVCEV